MEQTTSEAVLQNKTGGARLKKGGGKLPLVVVGVIVGVLVLAYAGL